MKIDATACAIKWRWGIGRNKEMCIIVTRYSSFGGHRL